MSAFAIIKVNFESVKLTRLLSYGVQWDGDLDVTCGALLIKQEFPDLTINIYKSLIWSLLTTHACGTRAGFVDASKLGSWAIRHELYLLFIHKGLDK